MATKKKTVREASPVVRQSEGFFIGAAKVQTDGDTTVEFTRFTEVGQTAYQAGERAGFNATVANRLQLHGAAKLIAPAASSTRATPCPAGRPGGWPMRMAVVQLVSDKLAETARMYEALASQPNATGAETRTIRDHVLWLDLVAQAEARHLTFRAHRNGAMEDIDPGFLAGAMPDYENDTLTSGDQRFFAVRVFRALVAAPDMPPARRPGAPASASQRVADAMRSDIRTGKFSPAALSAMKQEDMQSTYGAARPTCEKARKIVMSECHRPNS